VDELESDGIIRDLFGVDGRRLASFNRGDARRFLRALSERDEALALRIQDAFDTTQHGGGPWRYALAEREEAAVLAALDDLRGAE